MIREIDIREDEWDLIVENKIVHFTRNYCLSFALQERGIPVLFLYEEKNTRAFQVMFKREIDTLLGKYYDVISPYGYGGWIIEGDYNSNICFEYIDYCKKKSIISEFIRFDLFRTDISKYYGNIRLVSHNIVKNVASSEIAIFDDFERRVKKNIRKAIKNNLNVVLDDEFNNLQDFKEIYYSTMDRNSASDNYYFSNEFFDMIIKHNCKLFHVYLEDKIISTELVLYDDKCSYSFLGGTLNEYFHLRPTEILKYEIMKWSHENKLKYFVLGGGFGSDDGIYVYKKGLAPTGVYNFYVGSNIFDEGIYKNLCIEKNILNLDDQFFPLYRRN